MAGFNKESTHCFMWGEDWIFVCRSQWPRGLRRGSALVCWDCGFESRRGHGCLCCKCCVRSMRQADPSSRGVLPNMVRSNKCYYGNLTMRRPTPTRATKLGKKYKRYARTRAYLLYFVVWLEDLSELPNNSDATVHWRVRGMLLFLWQHRKVRIPEKREMSA